MTVIATQPIVSGRTYQVLEIADQGSVTLEGFVGPARFLVDLDGVPYPVCGVGRRVGDVVRFYQKTHDGQGRDIRTWEIRAAGAGAGFCARHGEP